MLVRLLSVETEQLARSFAVLVDHKIVCWLLLVKILFLRKLNKEKMMAQKTRIIARMTIT